MRYTIRWVNYLDLWRLIYKRRRELAKYRYLLPIPRAGDLVANFISNLTGAKIIDRDALVPSGEVLIVDDSIGGGKTMREFRRRYPHCKAYVPLVLETKKDLVDFYSEVLPLDSWGFYCWELDVGWTPFKVAFDFDGVLHPRQKDYSISPDHLALPKMKMVDIVSARWEEDRDKITRWCNTKGVRLRNLHLMANHPKKKVENHKLRCCLDRGYKVFFEDEPKIAQFLGNAGICTICVRNLKQYGPTMVNGIRIPNDKDWREMEV